MSGTRASSRAKAHWARFACRSRSLRRPTRASAKTRYCFEPTGILRDGDDNALGGVRLPDLHVGRATYIASDPGSIFAGLPGLLGDSIDLSCAVDENGRPRFKNHGKYVSAFVHQANALRNAGFLLEDDAELLKDEAGASSVGKPGSCD